jgi:hypothetical protein
MAYYLLDLGPCAAAASIGSFSALLGVAAGCVLLMKPRQQLATAGLHDESAWLHRLLLIDAATIVEGPCILHPHHLSHLLMLWHPLWLIPMMQGMLEIEPQLMILCNRVKPAYSTGLIYSGSYCRLSC